MYWLDSVAWAAACMSRETVSRFFGSICTSNSSIARKGDEMYC